jgi:predicted transcriptional regulator
MVPDRSVLELPNGTRFWAWAIAQPGAQPQFGQAPVMHATMLLRPIPNTQNAPLAQAQNVGPGCQVCPRDQCPARRMASLVSA